MKRSLLPATPLRSTACRVRQVGRRSRSRTGRNDDAGRTRRRDRRRGRPLDGSGPRYPRPVPRRMGLCRRQGCAQSDLRSKSAGKHRFVQSLGELTAIDIASPDDITVTLAMEGEGEVGHAASLRPGGRRRYADTATGEESFEPCR